MKTHFDLIRLFGKKDSGNSLDGDPVHATMTAFRSRVSHLEKSVDSLISQVDTLHLFLQGFKEIPLFLEHENIFISLSSDFGNLGECGKYYWTDDLHGYHLICSDKMVYPPDYVERMRSKVESYGRKAIIAAGGYCFKKPFKSIKSSGIILDEAGFIDQDVQADVLNDRAAAYHSSTLKMSRHYFYQDYLSSLWFSIAALEQQIPMICCAHKQGWLRENEGFADSGDHNPDAERNRDFLIKSHFLPTQKKPDLSKLIKCNRYFDKIWVMNLNRRPDRWQNIQQISRINKIRVSRFRAIDGAREPFLSEWKKYFSSKLLKLPEGIDPLTDYKDKFLKYDHYVARIHFIETRLGRKAIQSAGAWGYLLSYIKIIRDAIESDYQRILIFDDDIVLHRHFQDEFDRHVRQLPCNWKLIMLGAMQHSWEPYVKPSGALFYHCFGSSIASHAVAIDRKAMLPILYYAEKMDLPLDEGAIFHVKNVYPEQCCVFLPNLAIQDLQDSDINSSAMTTVDKEKWMQIFRWKEGEYVYPSRRRISRINFNILRKFIAFFPVRKKGLP
jgi:GR25 family glycosyltransferase involved in LPS biosynthesis